MTGRSGEHRDRGPAAPAAPPRPAIDADLPERVLRALAAAFPALAAVPLEPMADTGLAHHHLRLRAAGAAAERDLVARVPKQSQLDLSAAANLAYQSACFQRAAAGGHTPCLHGMLPPSPALPRGALLVEYIAGRPARLPDDAPAIARALASLHALPLPAARAPLRNPPHTLQALAEEIDAHAAYLPEAGIAPFTAEVLADTLTRWRDTTTRAGRPPRRLISFDAHPGNFLVRADGRAVLVDLEKARYGDPPLDLAHATLYTSTTWDVQSRAVLSAAEVAGFVESWAAAWPAGSEPWRRWLLPLREGMWLWSMTWCAKWRVLSRRAARVGGDGEDWSAARSDAALVTHVRGRVDHYLAPDTVARMQQDFAELARLL